MRTEIDIATKAVSGKTERRTGLNGLSFLTVVQQGGNGVKVYNWNDAFLSPANATLTLKSVPELIYLVLSALSLSGRLYGMTVLDSPCLENLALAGGSRPRCFLSHPRGTFGKGEMCAVSVWETG